MTSPCIVIATFTPKPEHYDEVKKLLLDIAPEVHEEEGCELYALHEEVKGSLVFVEKWTTRELWKIHATLSTVARIKSGVEGLLQTDIDVREMYGVGAFSGFPGTL